MLTLSCGREQGRGFQSGESHPHLHLGASLCEQIFIYFRLHWVLMAVRGLSLSMMVLLQSTGSTAQAQQLGAQA